MVDMNAVLSGMKGKTVDYAVHETDACPETIIIYFTDGSNIEINAENMKIFFML